MTDSISDFDLRRPSVAFHLAAVLWCLTLLAGRMFYTGTHFYAFLVWNLFLAILPMLAARCLLLLRPGATALAVLGFWLLFFPNAPYVVTDLLHLRPRHGVPIWFDLLLLLSFASLSLRIGLVSVRDVHRWIGAHFSSWLGWGVAVGSLFLAGFGVYLGRVLRWNSWDVMRKPIAILRDIADRALDPMAHPGTWAFTLGFGVFFTAIYLGFRSMPEQRNRL